MRVSGDLSEARRVLDYVEHAFALVMIDLNPVAIVGSHEEAFYAIDAAYAHLDDDGDGLTWALVYLDGPGFTVYASGHMVRAIWLACCENAEIFDLYVDAFGAEADA